MFTYRFDIYPSKQRFIDGYEPIFTVLTKHHSEAAARQCLEIHWKEVTDGKYFINQVSVKTGTDLALLEVLKNLVADIEALMAASDGVSGLHLNGDIAEWSSLIEGGRFEGWLSTVATAQAFIAKTEGETT